MEILNCLPTKNFTIRPSESILTASKLLIENHLHRLPIIDSTNAAHTIISVLTQSKILRFVAAQELDAKFLNCTLKELGIGTYSKLITARADTPLIEIMRTFTAQGISSVPIVDENSISILY